MFCIQTKFWINEVSEDIDYTGLHGFFLNLNKNSYRLLQLLRKDLEKT